MAKEAKVYRGQEKKAYPVPFRRKKVMAAQTPEPCYLLSRLYHQRQER